MTKMQSLKQIIILSTQSTKWYDFTKKPEEPLVIFLTRFLRLRASHRSILPIYRIDKKMGIFRFRYCHISDKIYIGI